MAWIQAGMLARYPRYYWIGGVYALPLLQLVLTRRLPVYLIGLSWGLGLLHVHLQKHEINQRIAQALPVTSSHEELMRVLLQAALKHRGCLSVTQGVMETGKSFQEVERVLNEMLTSGYVFTRNNPDTGVLEYVFKELL
jgi:hypothetical protein